MNNCLIIVFPLLVAWPAAASAQTANRPPNVLFIAIDDLNDWGFDDKTPVGTYEAPARFDGTIHGVDVKAD